MLCWIFYHCLEYKEIGFFHNNYTPTDDEEKEVYEIVKKFENK